MSRSILVIDTPEACIDCPCHFAYEDGTVPSYKVGYNAHTTWKGLSDRGARIK